MATIEVAAGHTLSEQGNMAVPATLIPSFRAQLAVSRGLQKKFLIYICGGLGDAICAEPSIRYACENFEDTEITVASYWPELYGHLPLKATINLFDNPKPSHEYFGEYFVFKSLFASDELHSEFIPHMFTHVVDYHSLSMFRTQLDNEQKRIVLHGKATGYETTSVVLHPGRTWQSRTIPAPWWNKLIKELLTWGHHPTIIGATTKDPKLGTIEIDTTDCLDLRDKLSIMETVDLLQKSPVLITNDSSPLHMAASGRAWIGFLSTVKRPDLLYHCRGPHVAHPGWKMENLALGGMWQTMNMNPNNSEMFYFDKVDPDLLLSWLPKPSDVSDWAISRANPDIVDRGFRSSL